MPLPTLETLCGHGSGPSGLAACPALGLLVVSDLRKGTLAVWQLPALDSVLSASGGARASAGQGASGASVVGGGGLRLQVVCTLGGDGSAAPMQFMFFSNGWGSGYLAFTPAASTTTFFFFFWSTHRVYYLGPIVGHRHNHGVQKLASIAAQYWQKHPHPRATLSGARRGVVSPC